MIVYFEKSRPFTSKRFQSGLSSTAVSILILMVSVLNAILYRSLRKDRYSIAFNTETIRMSMDTAVEDNPDWNRFEVNGLDFSK